VDVIASVEVAIGAATGGMDVCVAAAIEVTIGPAVALEAAVAPGVGDASVGTDGWVKAGASVGSAVSAVNIVDA
jgi:hypothetical protein